MTKKSTLMTSTSGTPEIDPADLRHYAILVRLTTKRWGVVRKDKRASKAAAEKYGADEKMIGMYKHLINPAQPEFHAIKKMHDAGGNKFRSMVGPWDTEKGGYFIIVHSGMANLEETIREYSEAADQLVDDFIAALPDVIREAKEKLGEELWDESLIPTAQEIREKFVFKLEKDYLPEMPKGNGGNMGMRINKAMSETLAKDVRERTERRFQGCLEDTHKTVRDELEQMLSHMREYGDDIKGSKKKRTFKDGMIDRMTALSNLLPALNLTGDPRIDAMGKLIADKLANETGDELRGNKVAGDQRTKAVREADAARKREVAADVAEELLSNLDDIFG